MSGLPKWRYNIQQIIDTVTVTGSVIVSGTVTVTGTVSISGAVTVTGTVAISGTVEVKGAVTVTGAVTVSGTVSITGDVHFDNTTIDVSGSSVTVSGTVAISGTVTVTGAVTVTGTVAISGTVTVTGSVTVSGTVAISGTVTITGTVAISGTVTVTGSVTVSGTVAISGTVTITGTVAISGTVTITGSVSITGSVTITGAVTITSGAVTISTIGGTNIILDQLIQGAYISRGSTLSNDNGVTDGNNPPSICTAVAWRGKFFPRGCRGHIARLWIYCKTDDGGTITLQYAVYMGMGSIGSVTITPEATWKWKSADVNLFWKHDSMFLWVSACGVNTRWGFDEATPFDAYHSDDSGASWYPWGERFFYRVELTGETVGDLPISGIINNVQLPNTSSQSSSISTLIPATTEISLVIIYGSGFHEYTVFQGTQEDNIAVRVYCDDVLIDAWTGASLSVTGFTASTPKISLTQWTADGPYDVLMSARYEFNRKFEIRAYNSHVVESYYAWVKRCVCNILK